MTLLDILTAAGIGLTIGAIAALLAAPTRRKRAARPDDCKGAPPGWEYRTEYRREYLDSGLLYEESFTILVPKQPSVRVEHPQRKRLTGGA